MCVSRILSTVGGGCVHPLGRHFPRQTPPLGSPLGRPSADTPGADTPLPRQTPPSDGHCSGRCVSYWNAFLLQRNFIFIYIFLKPVKITDTFVILGTPPDYNNHYPTDDDKKLFIRHYLKEKLKITESEPVEDDTFERKSKHLFVQVCKCELVG